MSFPITHKSSVAPVVKRDGDVPLFNISTTSYLVERKNVLCAPKLGNDLIS